MLKLEPWLTVSSQTRSCHLHTVGEEKHSYKQTTGGPALPTPPQSPPVCSPATLAALTGSALAALTGSTPPLPINGVSAEESREGWTEL